MPMHFRDGAAWRVAKELHFRDGAAWRKAKEVWVHDGTAWRKAFSGGAIVNPLGALSFDDSQMWPDWAVASISFLNDGTLGGVAGDWYAPTSAGIGASYWIRATLSSGNTPAGAALNTWHSLSTARGWSLSQTTQGSKSCTLNISIASDSAGTNIVSTGTLSLSVMTTN